MDVIEHVSDEVRQRFRDLAYRVAEALSEAGLPVEVHESPPSGPDFAGAEVSVENEADELAGVWVNWHPAPELVRRATEAVRRGEFTAPDIEQNGRVARIMQGALLALLQQANFAVRESDHEYATFQLRVDSGPAT